MARSKKRITDHERALRASAYEVYRDMGKHRTYDQLIIKIEKSHGVLSKFIIARWAKEERWVERINEFDRSADPDDHLDPIETDPDFDQADALLRTAHLALKRVLRSHPRISTPQDAKAMVDAAAKAIDLVHKINITGRSTGKATVMEQAQKAQALFDKLHAAVRAKRVANGETIQRMPDAPAIEVEFTEIETPHGEQAQLPAPTEAPLSAPDIITPAEIEASAKAWSAPKTVAQSEPRTVAERLAAARRRT